MAFGRGELVLPMRGRAPELALVHELRRVRLVASGSWTVREAAMIERRLAEVSSASTMAGQGEGIIDLSEVDHLDTAGASLILRLRAWLSRCGLEARITGSSEHARLLLEEVGRHVVADQARSAGESPLLPLLHDAAMAIRGVLSDAVRLIAFLGALTQTVADTLMRPWRFRHTAFVHHLEHCGLRALPIIAVMCMLIGAVVLQQGALQMRPYGAEPFAVDMLVVLSLREIGVLLAAIMVAGRSGSAYTAEIGAMRMREEIDAMRTLGLDPMQTLVLPRILALMVALPILAFTGAMLCLAGGLLAALWTLGMPPAAYLERAQEAAGLSHLFVGMVKTPFAALVIGLVSCIEGLSVAGSAESLGRHVTRSVVRAIFLVIVLDGVFAIVLAGMDY